MTDDVLAPGDTTAAQTISFYDPNQIQFTYKLVVLGMLNQPSAFTSVPVITATVGQAYSYAYSASDLDGDTVSYSLLAGPGTTGTVGAPPLSWTPTAADVGTHNVAIEASDLRGGTAEQDFVITVVSDAPNLPPRFTSTPIVDANVNVPYVYQATAVDDDGDTPLTFSLVSGPPDGTMTVSSSGLVQWTPQAGEVGSVSVTLMVDDGHGNTAEQPYQILVQQQPGNDPPHIISTAPPSVVGGYTYTYTVKAIDADSDDSTYSLVSGPPGMTVDRTTGLLTWPTTPADDGTYSVTVKADDGRGAFDTQTFPIDVVNTQPAAIFGTKYEDFNGNGKRDPLPPPVSPIPITATSIGIPPNDWLSAVAYDEHLNTMLVSELNISLGETQFWTLAPNGTTSLFATVPETITDSNNFTVVPDHNTAGFMPGDIFFAAGYGSGPTLVRVTNNGASSQLNWLASDLGGPVMQVQMDTTGLFGDNLLAVVGYDGGGPLALWEINAQGTATLLASALTMGDAFFSIIPNDPAQFGPLAGKAVFPQMFGDQAMTVAPDGTVQTLTIPGLGEYPTGIDYVPAGGTFFSTNEYGSSQVWIGASSDFAPYQGDLVSPDLDGSMTLINYNGTSLSAQAMATTATPPPHEWENSVFQPGYSQWQEPGLPNWTVYLDLNHDGHLDPGDPYTVTDASGNYSFTGLVPGTYTVGEVMQPGWYQTEPGNTSGEYTLTLSSGQNATGIDFGNKQGDNPATNHTPAFVTQPVTTATVGQAYVYRSIASDDDADALTYDLPVHPDGMAIDPTTGIIVWTPTADEVGQQNVIARVDDGRGGVKLQPFTVTVSEPNLPPRITSNPPSLNPTIGQEWAYPVTAQDPENDTLTYEVLSGPNEPNDMAFNGPLLTWTPSDATPQTIVIGVDDGHGNVTSQTFTLNPVAAAPNSAPTVSSTPGGLAVVGEEARPSVPPACLRGRPPPPM